MMLNQFEQWQAAVIADLSPDAMVSCPHCDGQGETTCGECECSKCCTDCNGAGELRAEDMSDDDLRKSFNREKYHRACIEDLVRVAVAADEPEFVTLATHGYNLYSLPRHRQLEASCPDGKHLRLQAIKPNEIVWARQ